MDKRYVQLVENIRTGEIHVQRYANENPSAEIGGTVDFDLTERVYSFLELDNVYIRRSEIEYRTLVDDNRVIRKPSPKVQEIREILLTAKGFPGLTWVQLTKLISLLGSNYQARECVKYLDEASLKLGSFDDWIQRIRAMQPGAGFARLVPMEQQNLISRFIARMGGKLNYRHPESWPEVVIEAIDLNLAPRPKGLSLPDYNRWLVYAGLRLATGQCHLINDLYFDFEKGKFVGRIRMHNGSMGAWYSSKITKGA